MHALVVDIKIEVVVVESRESIIMIIMIYKTTASLLLHDLGVLFSVAFLYLLEGWKIGYFIELRPR